MLLKAETTLGNRVPSVPSLYNGDRLSQPEFHERYERYPDQVKLELIKGTVYMASPEGRPHSKYAVMLTTVLGNYQAETPGVEAGSDPTVILGDESEPRPDLLLRILPDCGGSTRDEGLYVAGPPELIIEIAYSSVAIDLHQKKDDYEQNGVVEYVVVCIEEEQIHWFDLRKHKSNKLAGDGILRSKTFPGLWIDTKTLFRGELKPLLRTLNEGLASPEHARFVRRLERRWKKETD